MIGSKTDPYNKLEVTPHNMQRHIEHSDDLDAQFDALLGAALSQYQAKQATFSEEIAGFSKWEIEEETATLCFSGSNNKTLSYQIVPAFTYLPQSESLAWSWGNESFPEHSRTQARRIKELTRITGYKIFEVSHFRARQIEIDELCALALHALNGKAIFKVKDQEPWVYYVIQ